MSSNMKVVYDLTIRSNIAQFAQQDAQHVEASQRKMTQAIGRTDHSLVGLERNLSKLANNTTMQRQIGYMDKLRRAIESTAQQAKQLQTIFQQGLGKGANVVAGGAAGLYAANAMTRAPMDFDLQLQYAAGTAYAGRSASGVRAGKAELRAMVHDVVRKYGGDRGQVLHGYTNLVGQGEFTADEAKVLLPQLQKVSMATGTDATKLSSLGTQLKGSLGIAPKDIGLAFSRLARVGQLGGVEIDEMSPLLAQMSGQYPTLGYKGQRGAVAAAADLQIARKGAGSAEEAKTILDNFYGKIMSTDTAKDFAKIKGEDGKGIDLNQRMALRMAKGMDGVEAFLDITDSVLAKTGDKKKVDAILSQANMKDPAQQEEASKAIKSIFERAGIGEFIQDKEAMRGFLQLRSRRDERKTMIDTGMSDNGQAMDVLSEGAQGTSEIQRQKLVAESTIAVDTAFRALSPAIDGLMSGVTGLAKEFPAIGAAIAGMTGAATVATAALTAMGIASVLTGGGAVPGVVSKLMPGLVGVGAAGAAGAFGRMGPPLPAGMSTSRWLGRNLGKFVPGVGFLMDAGSTLADDSLSADGKVRGVARAGTAGAAGWMGASSGAAVGAALGSVVPILGTAVGGAVGGIAGGLAGYYGGGQAFDSVWKSNKERDYLQFTDTKGTPLAQAGADAQPTTVQLGEGVVTFNVNVTDDRVLVNPFVTQQPSLIKINPGATNPGGMR
jgi:hypothetical protein